MNKHDFCNCDPMWLDDDEDVDYVEDDEKCNCQGYYCVC